MTVGPPSVICRAALSAQMGKLKGMKQFPSTRIESDLTCPLFSRYLEVLVEHTHVWLLVITVPVLPLPSQCCGRTTACW